MRIRFVAVLALVAGMLFIATPAQAAGGCVSRTEFRSITAGMTPAQVVARTGARARVVASTEAVYRFTTGYLPNGTPIVETNYVRDFVYSYPRCRGGRVGVSFDSYSDGTATTPNVTSVFKTWRNPSGLVFWK